MVPLGVIGMIYESRPNVTIDAAALCIKSGNAVILRGGSEAINSNMAFYNCIKQGVKQAGLNPHSVQLIEVTDREAVTELVKASDYVDAIIPRGGKGLIKNVSSNSPNQNQAKLPIPVHGVKASSIYKTALKA